MEAGDSQLLRRFARDGSEEAFAELVRRHAGLVYSAALRQVNDAGTAEDISQSVFIILFQKAASLAPNVVLGSWLLTVTRLTAQNARRRLARQKHMEVSQMNETAEPHVGAADASWAELLPALDDGLAALSDQDRGALVLRYLERRSIREVAEITGLKEKAAAKRVERALERLRAFFTSKKIHIGAVALAALLAERAVSAAPAKLVAGLAGSTSAAAAGAQQLAVAKEVMAIMAISKAKVAASAAIVVLLAGAGSGVLLYKIFHAESNQVAAQPLVVQPDALRVPEVVPPVAIAIPAPVEQIVPVGIPVVPVNDYVAPEGPDVQRVDLMPRIYPEADTVNGFWTREGNALKSDGTAFGRFEIPYEPPADYDFKIVFTVKTARGDVAQMCASEAGPFTWKMGALANRYAIIEATNNKGDDNESRYLKQPMLESGKTYESVVRVRGNLVEGYMDGKRVSKLAINPTGPRPRGSFWSLPHDKTLGVGVWATVCLVQTIEITEVRGHGRWLRGEGEQPVSRALPELAPDAAWAKAVDVLAMVDAERDTVAGIWKKSPAGTITSDETPYARIETNYRPPEEYDLRTTFTRKSSNTELVQLLGVNGKSFYFRAGYKVGSLGFANIHRTDFNPTTSIAAVWVQRNVPMTTVIQVRKNYIAAFADGKLVIYWPTNYSEFNINGPWITPTAGMLGFGSNGGIFEFSKMELRPVEAEGTVVPANGPKRMAAPPVEGGGGPVKPPVQPNDAF